MREGSLVALKKELTLSQKALVERNKAYFPKPEDICEVEELLPSQSGSWKTDIYLIEFPSWRGKIMVDADIFVEVLPPVKNLMEQLEPEHAYA